jgi:hypothetical protein
MAGLPSRPAEGIIVASSAAAAWLLAAELTDEPTLMLRRALPLWTLELEEPPVLLRRRAWAVPP